MAENQSSAPAGRTRWWTISEWPVRSKVAIVVIVPIVLAIVLGFLRVQESYQRASELAQSGGAVEVLAPAAELDAAKDALLSSGGGNPQAVSAFAASVDQLGAALAGADVSEPVRVGLENALTAATGLRDRLAIGIVPPTDLNRAAADIFAGLRSAILDSAADDIEAIRTAKVGLVAAAEGRQDVAAQQLLVGPFGGESAVDLTGATAAAGREQGAIASLVTTGTLGQEQAARLQAVVDARLAAYREADLTDEPVEAGAIDSFGESRDIYTGEVQTHITALGTALDQHSGDARTVFVRDLVLITLAVLAALIFAAFVARSLVRSLRVLREGALAVARDDLPTEILQIRAGGEPPVIRPIPIESREEVGQVARAVDAIHEEALMLAGEQTRLRLQIGSMFETLSRRSRSLVDQQLALIDRLERDEDDPSRLDSLFRLDHLAARMRRNGANLLVLAGTQTRRSSMDAVSLDAIIGSAVSEVEDYQRVLVKDFPQVAVAGSAVDDLVHLLAELLDNALRYSPPNTAVTIGARRTPEGIDLEIIDHGLGIPAAELEVANERLASGGDVTAETARRMGLFVVGRLARTHALNVRLRTTSTGQGHSGITAEVRVPVALLAAPNRPDYPQPVAEQGLFDDRQSTFGGSDQARGDAPAANGTAPTYAESATADGATVNSTLPAINGRRPGDGPVGPPLPTRQPVSRNRADAPAGPSAGLPQRRPGRATSDGETGVLPAVQQPWSGGLPQRHPSDSAPTADGSGDPSTNPALVDDRRPMTPSNTSAFFGARHQRRADSETGDETTADAGRRDDTATNEPRPAVASYASQPATADDPARPRGRAEEHSRGRGSGEDSSRARDSVDDRAGAGPDGKAADAGSADSLFSDPYSVEWMPSDSIQLRPRPRRGVLASRLRANSAPGGGAARAHPAAEADHTTGSGPADAGQERPDGPARGQRVARTSGTDAAGVETSSAGRRRASGAPSDPSRRHAKGGDGSTARGPQRGGHVQDPTVDTPIFSRLSSDWLNDPAEDLARSNRSWSTAADSGWSAAEEAFTATVSEHSKAGLPVRDPGRRLVPGTADTSAPVGSKRDPETVRSTISNHLEGVRNARSRIDRGRHRLDKD